MPKRSTRGEGSDVGPGYSTMKRLSDEELFDLIKGGNHDAFARLFDRYYRLVLSIATRILRDGEEAEDLMQEVFFEIFQRAGAFDSDKGTVKYWIMRFAYARSLDRLDYLRVRRFYQPPRMTEVHTANSNQPGFRRGGLTAEEWSLVLREGLAGLNPKQRDTLELFCFKGHSLREIADILQESYGNVRNHYYRGIENLRAFFNQQSSVKKNLARSAQEVVDAE